MAITTRGLTGPGHVDIAGGVAAGMAAGPGAGARGGRGGGQAVLWGVGDPVAHALSGLAHTLERYQKTMDDVAVADYVMRASKELDERYNNPETGLFATRKGAAADGMYREFRKDISELWEKDAQENLTERQRRLASRPLGALFKDYAHRIGRHETGQMMEHQKQTAENAVFNAKNLIAGGNFTEDDLGNALNAVKISQAAIGAMEGWDAATTQRNIQMHVGDMLTKGAAGLAATDPVKALGMLRTYRALIPEIMYQPAMQAMQKKAEAHAQRAAAVRENAQADGLAASLSGLPEHEQLAAWNAKYGTEEALQNPALQREGARVLTALRRQMKARREQEKLETEIRQGEIAGEVAKAMRLAPQERHQALMDLAGKVLPEDRDFLFKQADKIAKDNDPMTWAKRVSDPGAVEEASNRIAAGEVFDIDNDYAGTIAPVLRAKMGTKAARAAMPTIRRGFDENANLLLGDKGAGKEIEKLVGKGGKAQLWNIYQEGLSDEERANPVLAKKKAEDFFKRVLLDPGTFSSDREGIKGLEDKYLEADPDMIPARGTPERGALDAYLRQSGINDRSRETLGRGYRQMRRDEKTARDRQSAERMARRKAENMPRMREN